MSSGRKHSSLFDTHLFLIVLGVLATQVPLPQNVNHTTLVSSKISVNYIEFRLTINKYTSVQKKTNDLGPALTINPQSLCSTVWYEHITATKRNERYILH